jgi:hypothetical protein
MDNGGIWPGDEGYFRNIRETALQDTIEQLTKELAEAGAEIERKDKLIEQMREALSLILEGAIHDFHYVCQHRDNCLCWSCQKKRVNAALSAAERLEE